MLGGPRSVGQTLVMDVQAGKELPYGVYWQAIVDHTYEDGGWQARKSDAEELIDYPDAGPLLNVPLSLSRTVITQTVTND